MTEFKTVSFTCVSILLTALLFLFSCGELMASADDIDYKTLREGIGISPNYGDTLIIHLKITGESGKIYLDTYQTDEPLVSLLGLDERFTGLAGLFLGLKESQEIIIPEVRNSFFVTEGETVEYRLLLAEVISPLSPRSYDIPGKMRITTSSGLEYILIKEGSGLKANLGYTVTFHFDGYLTDKTLFSSTAEEDKPVTLTLGIDPMIKGWVEGLALMREGDKMRLIIPPELGFQPENRPEEVPEDATLIFDIIMLNVE